MGKPRAAGESSSVVGKHRQLRQSPPSRHTHKTSWQKRLFPWLTAVAALLAILSYLTPPIRHILWPPKLEWRLIGQAARKSYWISVNLVAPVTGSSSETVCADMPVYFLPVRLKARRGNLDVKACHFAQGDPSSDHLTGTPVFYRMQGDAVLPEELDEVCQALLAHDLNAARGTPNVEVGMSDMAHHLERYRSLQDRVVAIPITLRQDESIPFLVVCVPRLYTGERDYFAALKDLPVQGRRDLYSRQQNALRRLASEDFTFTYRTDYGQELILRGQEQRQQ